MQIANVTVAIGGDAGNTVPKYGVTAAEIAVLRLIHGEDALTEIDPAGEIVRTNRAELDRLRTIYGGAQDGDGNRLVDQLFPGAGARVFATIAELEIPENFFKATGRVKAEAVPEPVFEVTETGAPPVPVTEVPPGGETSDALAGDMSDPDADGIKDMTDPLFG